ncbi:MAG: hypothetical protein ACOCPX_00560 [Halapricum sp.]
MSATGLCDVCGHPDVDHVCDRCGRLVCERHYDTDLGVCIECASEISDGSDRDDVDTYRF